MSSSRITESLVRQNTKPQRSAVDSIRLILRQFVRPFVYSLPSNAQRICQMLNLSKNLNSFFFAHDFTVTKVTPYCKQKLHFISNYVRYMLCL